MSRKNTPSTGKFHLNDNMHMIDKGSNNHKTTTPKNGRIFLLVFMSSFVFFICSAYSKEMKGNKINLAIHTQLKNNEILTADMIDLILEKGIVTMTGTVNNLLSRQYAAKTALTIKGVGL
jgi:hypothetical protein